MIIMGVDPGLSGALAFLDTDSGDLEILDMPTLKAGTGGKRIIDLDTLAREIDARSDYVRHAFVEAVSTRPGEGAVGAFSFGQGFGALSGIIVANFIPRTFVRPAVWKKALGVPAAKDAARDRASQLLPQHAAQWARVKDDGRAEAALIAYYGSKKL